MPDHTGGAHPTTSGLVVAAIARCWRSHRPHCLRRGGKSVVPDHTRGAHRATSGRFVDVPVSGAGCTTHVRDDVGGGGEWSVEWQPQRRMRRRLVPATHHLLKERNSAHELADARVAGDTREPVEVTNFRVTALPIQ